MLEMQLLVRFLVSVSIFFFQFRFFSRAQVWDAKPGRHNLFHALVLFLYSVRRYKAGNLAVADLGVLCAQLLGTVATDEFL